MKSGALLLVVFMAMTISCSSQITITFNVDMTGQTIEASGVHIAGQFAIVSAISITQDWEPSAAGSQLTKISSNIYSVQVTFPSSAAGKKLQFEFVRANVWSGYEDFSEGNPGDANAHIDNTCGVPDGGGGYNRMITIPTCGGLFDAVWNYCGVLTSSPVPTLTSSGDVMICSGQSAQLPATSNGSLLWSPTTGLSCTACDSPVASPTRTTTYTVIASLGICSVPANVVVTIDTSVVHTVPDQRIAGGETVQLNASGASSYSWQPSAGLSCTNCSSPVASPPDTTTYVVHGLSAVGCISSETVVVYVSKPPCEVIYFPSVFTPNGDNLNDTFGPLFTAPFASPIDIFRVYNRWGELVYETKDYTRRWDGNFHGVQQSAGTYIYYLQLNCKGHETVLKGVVTLVR
jgi:gliding motility-associated-like protein